MASLGSLHCSRLLLVVFMSLFHVFDLSLHLHVCLLGEARVCVCVCVHTLESQVTFRFFSQRPTKWPQYLGEFPGKP